MFVPERVRKFAELMFIREQALTYVVGGAVRDQFTGHTVKDYDLEVCGLPVQDLEAIEWAHVQPAGDRFGVWIVTFEGETFEVALPQVRHSSPDGDRSKEVAEIDPWLPIEQSLERRDFTCNAMAWGILTDELIDPFGGREDIRIGKLSCVNPVNFAHDPLRVLRGMVRCAKDNLTPDAKTLTAASKYVRFHAKLDAQRIREEWIKWACSPYPAKGLDFLRWTGWVVNYPLLSNLIGCEQDPEWHPEGDVWEHTVQAVDQVRSGDPFVVFATLLHDIGKPLTTGKNEQGRIVSPGHAEVSATLVPEFFRSIGFEWKTNEPDVVKVVRPLVAEHMWIVSFTSEPTSAAIKRLARRLQPATIGQWGQVCLADLDGRGFWSVSPDTENVIDVVERAGALDVDDKAPVRIITGKHLIAHDIIAPGPRMGRLLEHLEDLQLDGFITDVDGGLKIARELVEFVDLDA